VTLGGPTGTFGKAAARLYQWASSTSLIALINSKINPDLKPNYTKFYIGLLQGNRPNNFVSFTPRKKSCLVSIRLEDVEDYRAKLKTDGILEPLPGNSEGPRLRFHLTEGQVQEQESLLVELLQKAYKESIE
jgi:hypothetical protein